MVKEDIFIKPKDILFPMSKPVAVIALGGNALIEDNDHSLAAQEKTAQKALHLLPHLYKKYHLVITHGNGPQVGNLLLRSEVAAKKAYSVPLDYCVAQSQGEIGYLLSLAIEHVFAQKVPVVSLLTRVSVSPKDPAFQHPSKPIGDFYGKEKIKEWQEKNIPFVMDANRGYRRVVPSPEPHTVNEAAAIAHLAKKGNIVIAVGGGGIPMSGNKGIEAVIDKDKASALLATHIKAHVLCIITAVDAVYLEYLSKHRKRIKSMNLQQARQHLAQGEFLEGSMKPKIEAACFFLERGGKTVIITDPLHVAKALDGKAGTRMVR